MVSMSDSRSRGPGFDSRLVHRQATTLGKLLTPMPFGHGPLYLYSVIEIHTEYFISANKKPKINFLYLLEQDLYMPNQH